MVDDFCLLALGAVADVRCWFFFSFGIFIHYFFCICSVIYSGVFFFTWWPTSIDLYPPTHFARVLRWRAWIHTEMFWWMVGGVGWTTFRESPYESDFILMTQVRAIICCLLILFITQSGSCTLRPPRLLLCYFPLHRRQISWDITSSPLSSTATKVQTSEGLAWRLNKSARNWSNNPNNNRAFFQSSSTTITLAHRHEPCNRSRKYWFHEPTIKRWSRGDGPTLMACGGGAWTRRRT